MTSQLTPEQRMERWLAEEAPSQAPDRVLTTTFTRTSSTRQVRARRWRIPKMTTWQTSLAAATAFLLASVGGSALLVRTPAAAPVGAPGALAAVCPASAGTAAPAGDAQQPAGMAIVCLDGSTGLDLGLPRDAWSPGLSRDGRYVAFRTIALDGALCGSCGSSPYLAVAEVGTQKRAYLLAAIAHNASQAVWSPDGRRVAYQGEEEPGNLDIFVTDVGDLGAASLDGTTDSSIRLSGQTLDGSEATTIRLTTDPAIDEFPAWTPDGSSIVYANMGAEGPDDSGFSVTQAIWSVPAEGGTPTRLTDPDVAGATMPDVAPDGTIAYLTGYGEIWTMGADGSDPTPVSADMGGRAFSPRWSPDGSRIAVLRYHPGERTVADPDLGIAGGLALLDVVVVDPATGQVVDIGPRVATDYNPVSWTPDGNGLLVNRYLAD